MADTKRRDRHDRQVPENEARLAKVEERERFADLDDAELDFLMDEMAWLVAGNVAWAAAGKV